MAYISFTPVEIWWAWRSVIWCNPSYTPCSSCYWIATWRSDWAQSEFSLASVPTEYHLNLEVLNTKTSVIFIQSGKKYCKTLSVCNKLNILHEVEECITLISWNHVQYHDGGHGPTMSAQQGSELYNQCLFSIIIHTDLKTL